MDVFNNLYQNSGLAGIFSPNADMKPSIKNIPINAGIAASKPTVKTTPVIAQAPVNVDEITALLRKLILEIASITNSVKVIAQRDTLYKAVAFAPVNPPVAKKLKS